MTTPASGFKRLVEALNRLGIPFFVGGSAASSIHGLSRATMDIDVVADIGAAQVAPLVADLGSEFYADAETIRNSIAAGRAFNLIHYASSYKFDVFPLPPDEYYQTEFARRRNIESSLIMGEPLRFPVASAEDTILTKLVWYRSGGEISERQWRDVLGVLRISGNELDHDYLRKWAAQLGVIDLLEKALTS
jgi:hypothetical protein